MDSHFWHQSFGAIIEVFENNVLKTARVNGLNPQKYLEYLLESRPNKNMSDKELEHMAPWSQKVQ